MTRHDPADIPLPPLESALLWAMRAWVIGAERHVNVAGRMASLFSLLNAPDGAGYLGGLMWVLSHGATRDLTIHCTCNPEVSEDETRLLDMMALHQEGFHADALVLLTDMMPPPAARAGCDSAARLVQVLSEAGHRLPRGLAAVWRYGFQHSAQPVLLH